MSNAIQTKDNEANHFIIYCLNYIRHSRNATYEPGLSVSNAVDKLHAYVALCKDVQHTCPLIPNAEDNLAKLREFRSMFTRTSNGK